MNLQMNPEREKAIGCPPLLRRQSKFQAQQMGTRAQSARDLGPNSAVERHKIRS